MSIKLSIIIPVYNSEKFIGRCLDSLINQTLKDIEIICAFDYSTDNTEEILDKYAKNDSRIKIIKKEKEGLSLARNRGLEMAQGEYIGFVDADDYVELDFFERLYNSAKKHDCEIAVADFIRRYPKKDRIRLNITEEKVYKKAEDKYSICKTHREGCVWNKIYRKSLLDRINLRFIPNMVYEDRDFTAKALFYSNKMVTVPNTYYIYFVNKKSLVRGKQSAKLIADDIKSRQLLLQFIKDKNIKVQDGLYRAEKSRFKIFGKTLYTIRESINSEYIYLFGKIHIFTYKR